MYKIRLINNSLHKTFFKLCIRLNYESAKIAKRAAEDATRISGNQKYVAGAMGPTNRTLSISPSVEKPEFRNISKFSIETINTVLIFSMKQ